MKNYSIIFILVLLCQATLVADDIYSQLGISTKQKKTSLVNNLKRVDTIERCKLKKIYKKRLSMLLKHLKYQKVSENMTQYGLELEYEISKKIQLTIDVLADLDVKKPSRMIKDNQANIRLAISL